MGMGGLYSPIPTSPIGGYDDYFSGNGCSENDLETKRCSNVIKKLCTAGNITEVSTHMIVASGRSSRLVSGPELDFDYGTYRSKY